MMHRLSVNCGEPLRVELVGPAGSGKSTIIQRIANELGEAEVSSERLGFLTRVGLFVKATGDMLWTQGWRTWRDSHLRRGYSRYKRVSQGLLYMRSLSSGVALVDEGPVRTLADKAIYDDDMKCCWGNYCNKTIDAITHSCTGRILVVKISVDEKTRFERRKIRNKSKDASLESFKTFDDWQRGVNKKISRDYERFSDGGPSTADGSTLHLPRG